MQTQANSQVFFLGPEYSSGDMFATGMTSFDAHPHGSPWPLGTTNTSPGAFGMPTTDPWAMNGLDLKADFKTENVPSLSASPTSFDHSFASSPDSVNNGFSADFSSDGDEFTGASWKSINSDGGSFSSAMNDFTTLDSMPNFNELDVDKPSKTPRRRRKNVDPLQRHAEKLEKNRKAAERCRQKQRHFVSTLQERAREEEVKRASLIAQVSQLRDMILSLKESMVSHSGCNDERIKQYLLSDLAHATHRKHSVNSMPTTPMHAQPPPMAYELMRRQSGP